MSELPDQQFWDLADSFIELANQHCETVRRNRVSATLLYAAARFNSFVVATGTSSKNQLESEFESAVRYFVDQYEKMLRDNLSDHVANYEKYISEDGSAGE